MAIAHTNFDIDQGADFRFNVELLDEKDDPVDVSGGLIIGQVRKKMSSKVIDATFTVIPIDLQIGRFTLVLGSSVTGNLQCDLSHTAHRTLTQFAYDVEVHMPDGKVTRILQGVLNVSPEVTR